MRSTNSARRRGSTRQEPDERRRLLVDRELTERENGRLARAWLRHAAILEDLDCRTARGLNKGTVATLASGRGILDHLNVVTSGPAGVGKSGVACALAHRACGQGHRVPYQRVPGLFQGQRRQSQPSSTRRSQRAS